MGTSSFHMNIRLHNMRLYNTYVWYTFTASVASRENFEVCMRKGWGLLNPPRLAAQYLQEGANSLRFWPRSSYIGGLIYNNSPVLHRSFPLSFPVGLSCPICPSLPRQTIRTCTLRIRVADPSTHPHLFPVPSSLSISLLLSAPLSSHHFC
jgi:hypothetical protein